MTSPEIRARRAETGSHSVTSPEMRARRAESGGHSVTSLEMRYRRLLALYPRDFRREYEDEMLGVLMADPRPGPGQILDLVRSAMAARVRAAMTGDGSWREAARVVQLFGAVLLLGVVLRRVTVVALSSGHPGAGSFHFDTLDAVRAAGWSVALAAAIYGIRTLAAVGAAVGLAGEIAAPARYYLDTPATVLKVYWLIVAAAVVLVAGLLARPGSLTTNGGRMRGWLPVALACVGLILHGAVLYFGHWQLYVALPRAAAALIAVAVFRQEPAIRRRVVAWGVPVLVTVPLVQSGFAGLVRHNAIHPESLRMLGPVEWTVLVGVPVAAFVVAAELNRRLEVSRGFEGGGGGQVRAHE